MYKHILIATDGSGLAQKGVQHGLGLAKENTSKVTVVIVTPSYPLQSTARIKAWSDAMCEHAEEALQSVRTATQKYDLKIATHRIINDSPAEAIVEAAQSFGCDLIVMAAHGYRGVSRLLLGSQTAEVVNHSPIPVLVVR